MKKAKKFLTFLLLAFLFVLGISALIPSQVKAEDTTYWSFDFESEAPDQYFTDGSYKYASGDNIISGEKSLLLKGGVNINTSNKITIPSSTDVYVSFDIKFADGGANYIGNNGPVLICYTNEGDQTLSYVRVNMTADGVSLWADGQYDTTGSVLNQYNGVSHVSVKLESASEGHFTYFKLLDVNYGNVVIDNFKVTNYVAPFTGKMVYEDFDFESTAPDSLFTDGVYKYAESTNVIEGEKSLHVTSGSVRINGANLISGINASQDFYVSFDIKFVDGGANYIGHDGPVLIAKESDSSNTLGYVRVNMTADGVSLWADGKDTTGSVLNDKNGVSHVTLKLTAPSNGEHYAYYDFCDINYGQIIIDNFEVTNFVKTYTSVQVEKATDTVYFETDFEDLVPDNYFKGAISWAEGTNIISGSKTLQCARTDFNNVGDSGNNAAIPASTKVYFSFDFKYILGESTSEQMVWIFKGSSTGTSCGYCRFNYADSKLSLSLGEGATDEGSHIDSNGVSHIIVSITTPDEGYVYVEMCDQKSSYVIDNLVIANYGVPYVDPNQTYFDFDFESTAPDAYFVGAISYASQPITGNKSLQCERVDFNKSNSVIIPASTKVYFSFDFKYNLKENDVSEQMVWIAKDSIKNSSCGYCRFNLVDGVLSLSLGEGMTDEGSHIDSNGVSHIVISLTTPADGYLYIEMCDNDSPFIIDNLVIANYGVPYVAPETTKLDAPTNVTLTKDGDDYKISFDAVENAIGYHYQVLKGSVVVKDLDCINDQVIEVPTEKGTYKVVVKAKGDQELYTDSDYAEASTTIEVTSQIDVAYFSSDLEDCNVDDYFAGTYAWAEDDAIIGGNKTLICGRTDINEKGTISIPAGSTVYFSFDFKYVNRTGDERLVFIIKDHFVENNNRKTIGYARIIVKNGEMSLDCGEGAVNVDSHLDINGVSHIVFSVTAAQAGDGHYTYIEVCDQNCSWCIDNLTVANYPVPYVEPETDADMTEIKALLEKAGKIKQNYYTEATINVLKEKYQAAYLISQNEDATQAEVDAKKAELENAINALVMVDSVYVKEDFSVNAFGQVFNGSASIVRGEIGEGRSMKVTSDFATKGDFIVISKIDTYASFNFKFVGDGTVTVTFRDTKTDAVCGMIRLTNSNGTITHTEEDLIVVSFESGKLVVKFTSAENNTYVKFNDISGFGFIIDNFMMANYEYNFIPTEDIIAEQVVVFSDDFEEETLVVKENGDKIGSLPYSFDHYYFGIETDPTLVINGNKSLSLYHDHFITSPYVILRKGTNTYISFKFRGDKDVTMLQVLVRNFGGDHNDESCGYIRLFFNNGVLTSTQEDEGASFMTTPSVDENGVWTVSLKVVTKDYQDATSTYVHFTVDGTSETDNRAGWGYFDDIVITQDKEQGSTSQTLEELDKEEFGSSISLVKKTSTDVSLEVSNDKAKFILNGNVLNQADVPFFMNKYILLPGTYEISFELEMSGIGRILFNVYSEGGVKLGTLLYAPKSGATLYDYTDNIYGTCVKNNGKYYVTMSFTITENAKFNAYVYQDSLDRKESDAAYITISNYVVKSNTDKTNYELYKVYSDYSELTSDGYTTKSFAKLTQALQTAKQVIDGTNLVVSVQEAKASVISAAEALEEIGDNTELKRAIAKVIEYQASDYTSETFATFEEALTAANKVKANLEATQAEIDAALNKLNSAVNALVKAQTQEEDPVEDNPTGEKKKGCKGFTSIALVPTFVISTLSVIVLKKKRDDE